MRSINEVIVHCTATPANWWNGKRTSAKVAEIKRWHTDPKPRGRGWSDIGYHYLIDRDGTVAKGRPIERIGAHVAGHNTGTIGISLFGGDGSSENDAFSDNFTDAQDKSLRRLIYDLRISYPTITTISGHNQYAAKACPGFNAPKWYGSRFPKPGKPKAPAKRPAGGGFTWLIELFNKLFGGSA